MLTAKKLPTGKEQEETMKKGTKSLHWLLSLLLAAVMLLSCSAVTAFAAGSDGNTREAIYLGVPTDDADGVY